MGSINYDTPFIFNPANGGASLPLSLEITDGQTIASRRCAPNVTDEFTIGYHWETTPYIGTRLVTNEEVCAFSDCQLSFIKSLFKISTWTSKESYAQWTDQNTIPVVVPEVEQYPYPVQSRLNYYMHNYSARQLIDYDWQICLQENGNSQYVVAAPRNYEVIDFDDSTVTLRGIESAVSKDNRYILSGSQPEFRVRETTPYRACAPFDIIVTNTDARNLPCNNTVDFRLNESFYPVYLKHGLELAWDYPEYVIKPRAVLRSNYDIELKKGTLLYPDKLDVSTSAGRREYTNLCYETVGFICFNDLTGAS